MITYSYYEEQMKDLSYTLRKIYPSLTSSERLDLFCQISGRKLMPLHYMDRNGFDHLIIELNSKTPHVSDQEFNKTDMFYQMIGKVSRFIYKHDRTQQLKHKV